MNLNGTKYYYMRNANKDNTGIIDGAKNQVVRYKIALHYCSSEYTIIRFY